MKAIYSLFTCVLVFVLCQACNPNAKKQRLESTDAETNAGATGNIESSLLQSTTTLDTIIPNPGVKYRESRKINPDQPPVTLDFTGTMEAKELDIAHYFSVARYIKLKYPYPDKGCFLSDANISVMFGEGGSFAYGYNSSVKFTSQNIVAGDPYMGYHCYDLSGNFLYTVAAKDKFPDYDKTNNRIEMQYDSAEKQILSISAFKNILMISLATGSKKQLSFVDLTANKTYLTRPEYGGRRERKFLLSGDRYVDYLYAPLDTIDRPFLTAFDIQGDTLCNFYNYNPKPVPKHSASTNPDRGAFYYYDDRFTFRQAYNDTVYRMKSISELEPAYILHFGKHKLDIQTALYGDKTGKLIPYLWKENNRLIVFVYTENYDCPRCRESQTVHFYYAFYDKQEKRLYHIPVNVFPEDYWISSSIENAIPFTSENMQFQLSALYVSYTKAQLGKMLKHKNFSAIPAIRQTKMKELHDELDDSELVVMILE
jgi:hypothetical protein